jgi:hypothetical protein
MKYIWTYMISMPHKLYLTTSCTVKYIWTQEWIQVMGKNDSDGYMYDMAPPLAISRGCHSLFIGVTKSCGKYKHFQNVRWTHKFGLVVMGNTRMNLIARAPGFFNFGKNTLDRTRIYIQVHREWNFPGTLFCHPQTQITRLIPNWNNTKTKSRTRAPKKAWKRILIANYAKLSLSPCG